MKHFVDIELYQYRVTIDKHVEWRRWQEIGQWCRANFEDCTWRQALSGSPSISEKDFSTYLFLNKDDAVFFQLTWGGDCK